MNTSHLAPNIQIVESFLYRVDVELNVFQRNRCKVVRIDAGIIAAPLFYFLATVNMTEDDRNGLESFFCRILSNL